MHGGSVCAVAHYCFGVEPFGRPCRRSTAAAEWRDPGLPPGFRATLRSGNGADRGRGACSGGQKLEGYTGYVDALRRASIDVAANIAASLGP